MQVAKIRVQVASMLEGLGCTIDSEICDAANPKPRPNLSHPIQAVKACQGLGFRV